MINEKFFLISQLRVTGEHSNIKKKKKKKKKNKIKKEKKKQRAKEMITQLVVCWIIISSISTIK